MAVHQHGEDLVQHDTIEGDAAPGMVPSNWALEREGLRAEASLLGEGEGC